jgi:hypothetical protein
MTQDTVWQRRGALDKARREFMRNAMAEFDKTHYAAMRELQDECKESGHNWRFTHLGPLGDPWFSCTLCHASECRIDREGQ